MACWVYVIILECVNESLQGSASCDTVLHYKYIYYVWEANYTISYSYCKLMFKLPNNPFHWTLDSFRLL